MSRCCSARRPISAPAATRSKSPRQLRQLQVDETWIHEITRRKILFDQDAFTRKTFEEPEAAKKDLLSAVEAYLGHDYDIATHFTPKYRPWRQRIAFIPDGDLFQGIKSGKASVVTDEIDRFTEKGILLKSGKELEADIIITATGFHLSANGDIEFAVDGKKLDFADTVTYRGMMFTGVPNLVWVFGYFRASWTLRVDLVADFVCRLLKHMKQTGAKKVTPQLRPEDHNMPLLPWIDPENFNPGYMMRGMHLLPKRGDKPEWQHNQDYWAEKDEFPAIDLKDRAFVYGARTRGHSAYAGKLHRLRRRLAADHVGGLVGDHQGRGVEIGRDHPRHDRGVDHAQALQPVHAQLVVDHGPFGVRRSHAAGAAGMERGGAALGCGGEELIVALHASGPGNPHRRNIATAARRRAAGAPASCRRRRRGDRVLRPDSWSG